MRSAAPSAFWRKRLLLELTTLASARVPGTAHHLSHRNRISRYNIRAHNNSWCHRAILPTTSRAAPQADRSDAKASRIQEGRRFVHIVLRQPCKPIGPARNSAFAASHGEDRKAVVGPAKIQGKEGLST
jgi:hypothetical protein